MTHGNPGRSLGDFFRYHGWLSPGVRLFRRLGFPAKAICISLAFVAPLVFALAGLWADANGALRLVQKEHQGAVHARGVLKLLLVAQDLRHSAITNEGDIAALRNQESSLIQGLQGLRQQGAGASALNAAIEAVLQTRQSLEQQAASTEGEQRFAAYNLYLERILVLIGEIADLYGLTLDSGIYTHHIAAMALINGPRQFENTARLRTLGTWVLQQQSITPPQHDNLAQWTAIQQYLDDEVENAFQEGIAADPETAHAFDMQGTDKAFETFRTAITTQLRAATITGTAAEFSHLGSAAVERQVALTTQAMELLDTNLLARADTALRHLYLQIGVSMLFVAAAAYLLLSFYKVMMGGLEEVAGHLRQITQGNLTTAPTPWGKDEAAQLMRTLGEMQASLRRIVQEVLVGAAQVQGGSGDIAAASRKLSRQTGDAAASLEEAATSMEQIAAAVAQTSQTMQSALEIVNDNARVATRGGEVIAEVVQTMEGIQASSGKISDIISATSSQ